MRRKQKTFENVTIGDMAGEGKCVARVDNKVIFVRDVAPGDIADIKVIKKKKSYLEAVPTKLHKESALRKEPFCSHFGLCGGCKWQHIGYETQTKYKQQQVVDSLERIAKVALPEISPILAAEETTYYRNKLDFTFTNRRWLTSEDLEREEELEKNGIGFHLPNMFNRVVDIDHCYLQGASSNDIRNEVRKYALEHGLSFFNVMNHEGLLRNLIIRNTSIGQLMVIIQFYFDSEENKGLLEHLKNKFPEITSLLYIINEKKNETYYDLDIHTYHGEDHIIEELDGLKFKIGPKSFFQTNSKQAVELYRITKELAGLTGKEHVYDLYTGTGTIANYIAKDAKSVVGVESVPEAINDARVNSSLNGIENVRFYAGDMKDVLKPGFIEANGGKPDVVISDPPRMGMHPDVIDVLLGLEAEKIVYVSCNPATQARDLALLDAKYTVKVVQPVDMFPHTHHVENVVLLELR